MLPESLVPVCTQGQADERRFHLTPAMHLGRSSAEPQPPRITLSSGSSVRLRWQQRCLCRARHSRPSSLTHEWHRHTPVSSSLGSLLSFLGATQAPPEEQIRTEADERMGLVNGWQRGGSSRFAHHCDELYPPGGWQEPPGTPPVRPPPICHIPQKSLASLCLSLSITAAEMG